MSTLDNTSEEHLVVVAMSGGVDSSVAALLLAEQGMKALGVSMQVWDYRNNGGCASKATCCAPDDFTDARKVAARAGIPYYVFDFEKTFRTEVIDKFVETYGRGETPNPCVDCNNKVKFRELRNRARAFGATHVATGHYAQLSRSPEGYHLLRGNDRKKDQSYFLYGLSQEELSQTLFPVGHLSKEEVRGIAREAGLVTAAKPESQDICFVSGTVQDFLVKLGKSKRPGNIVTKEGVKVGEHDGIQNFTVGQRRGLHLGGAKAPLYVISLDPQANQVIVGEKHELLQEGFRIGELNWLSPMLRQKVVQGEFPFRIKGTVQVRSTHLGSPVEVVIESPHSLQVYFLDEGTSVCPGQAGVVYDEENKEVLVGGRILREI